MDNTDRYRERDRHRSVRRQDVREHRSHRENRSHEHHEHHHSSSREKRDVEGGKKDIYESDDEYELVEAPEITKPQEIEVVRSDDTSNTPTIILEVAYNFGDSGSRWRMIKLKRTYETAHEENRQVEDVALDRYGNLMDFDIAREEEAELKERELNPSHQKKLKPTGYLYEERGISKLINEKLVTIEESVVTQTYLNELNSKLLKARMRKSKDLSELEELYKKSYEHFQKQNSMGVLKSASDAKEQTSIEPVNEESKTIDDMLREELLQKNSNFDEMSMKSIMKDKSFKNDLDYQDENASNLASYVSSGKIDLKTTEIKNLSKYTKALDECQLCVENESIDIISMGSHVYLTTPLSPELIPYSCAIVPINHKRNTLLCEDDEWDEIRNYMKCLSRFYYKEFRKGVIFYECSASEFHHGVIMAVPLALDICDTIPGVFKSAILEEAQDWSQHLPLIDTLAKSKTLGKGAFRSSIAHGAPFFHVWFNIDGGLGHIIEDPSTWPRGDLFARSVIGGVLDLDAIITNRRGRWTRNSALVEKFKQKWDNYDWTRKS